MSLFLCFILFTRHCLSGFGAKDSTLNIEKICGESYSISLPFDNIDRKVFIYIPKILCDRNDALVTFVNNKFYNHRIAFDPTSHQITLPILIPLHCLSCSAKQEISKWISFAEQFTIILLAPQGSGSIPSWNGDQCCDPAVSEDIDDAGFIQTMINGAQTSFSEIFPFATVRNDNYDGYVWLTGYSNGAFMTDKIGWLSAVNQFSKLVAVAPMSGYIYNHTKYTHDAIQNDDKHNSVAVFFHHAKADEMVDANGCCVDESAGCCCNIAPKSSICVSIYEEYQNWLKWNHCDAEFEDIQTDSIIHDTGSGDKPVPVTCAFATPQEHGCDTYTAICLHGGDTHHTSWVRAPPQARSVIVFFLKSLCLQQSGKFNDFTVHCECGTESIYSGLHCISPKSALGISMLEKVATAQDNVVTTEIDDSVMKDMHAEMHKNMNMDSDQETNMNMEHIKMKAANNKHNVMETESKQTMMRNNKDLSQLGMAALEFYASTTLEFDSLSDESGSSLHEIVSKIRIPNTYIVLLCSIFFVSFGLFVMYKKRQSGYRYSKVNLHDEETMQHVVL